LLDQIQQKQADDYISKLREKQNAIELNQNSKRLLDEVKQLFKKGSSKKD
jgi:hypothetical protein